MIGLFIAIIMFLIVLFLAIIFPSKYLLIPLFFFFLSVYFITFSETLSKTSSNNNILVLPGYAVNINLFIILLAFTYILALIIGCVIKNVMIKNY